MTATIGDAKTTMNNSNKPYPNGRRYAMTDNTTAAVATAGPTPSHQ